jgi:hypothetical protein
MSSQAETDGRWQQRDGPQSDADVVAVGGSTIID